MDYLLDTQIAIWAKENSVNLKPWHRTILENADNELFVSDFSLQEVTIKLKIGKLPQFIISVETFANTLTNDGFQRLPIQPAHLFAYDQIPLYEDHRDPFDRFLLAVALTEKLTLFTADEKFDRYKSLVSVLMA